MSKYDRVVEIFIDYLDILFCNYIFKIVWIFPLVIHSLIKYFVGLTLYQYSSALTKEPYRWQFRNNQPEIHFDIIQSRFGYINFINESSEEYLLRIMLNLKTMVKMSKID